MTNRGDFGEHSGQDDETKKLFEDEGDELPEAIYPLSDGSYGDRQAYDAERASLVDAATSSLWGQGALLLNPSTKSYLTPFGFKALFEQQPQTIQKRFQRASLDPEQRYFQDTAPSILIHRPDGRLVPPSHLPVKPGQESLLLRFPEQDIYLQNYSRKSARQTGSYTPYSRAGQELREHHAEALQGLEPERSEEGTSAAAGNTQERAFKFRPRHRGASRRSTPSEMPKSGS